jgi:hypothetical protein
VQIRDLPPRRSLFRDRADSGSSRTGGGEARGKEKEVTSPIKSPRRQQFEGANESAAPRSGRPRQGTYVRKQRKNDPSQKPQEEVRAAVKSNKRHSAQVWRPIIRVEGEERVDSGKK